MNIGYIRAYNCDDEISKSTQKRLIEGFNKDYPIIDSIMIETKNNTRHVDDNSDLYKNTGYSRRYRGEKAYPILDSIAVMISTGKVESLIVDTKLRLRVNPKYNAFFDELCKSKNIKIHEVSNIHNMDPSGLVYHSIPSVVEFPEPTLLRIDELYKYCAKSGITVDGLYIDEGEGKYIQNNLKSIVNNLDTNDVLVARDLMHIIKPTGSFISLIRKLYRNGATIYTLKNGSYNFSEDQSILKKKLTAFFYDVSSANPYDFDIVKLFVELKTNWELSDYKRTDIINISDQITKCDVIIVRGFCLLNSRILGVERFLNMIRESQILYSLEEGCYFYGKESRVLCQGFNS